jgi:hypothetical protein
MLTLCFRPVALLVATILTLGAAQAQEAVHRILDPLGIFAEFRLRKAVVDPQQDARDLQPGTNVQDLILHLDGELRAIARPNALTICQQLALDLLEVAERPACRAGRQRFDAAFIEVAVVEDDPLQFEVQLIAPSAILSKSRKAATFESYRMTLTFALGPRLRRVLVVSMHEASFAPKGKLDGLMIDGSQLWQPFPSGNSRPFDRLRNRVSQIIVAVMSEQDTL